MELTAEDLAYFAEFGKITHVTPDDFMISEATIAFLVNKESLGKAIGKNGINIKRLSDLFRKRVVIISNSDDYEVLIRNMLYNVSVLSIEMREAMGEKALFVMVDERDRGIAIGKNGERIKMIKAFIKKRFNADVSLKTRRVLI